MGRESYELGRKGEEIAAEYLVERGCQIIERNFRSQQGEIDLIVKDKVFLVFVEVKSYSYRSYGSPVGAVRASKKESIIHAAENYLYKNNIKDMFCRFDVIAIFQKHDGSRVIDHYKDAFYVS